MGFVRTTCVRAGSMAKDWFDRAGLAARWVGVNVLSVEHYEWDREGYSVVLPDGSVEVHAPTRPQRARVRPGATPGAPGKLGDPGRVAGSRASSSASDVPGA